MEQTLKGLPEEPYNTFESIVEFDDRLQGIEDIALSIARARNMTLYPETGQTVAEVIAAGYMDIDTETARRYLDASARAGRLMTIDALVGASVA